jgi:hypothetical protein
MSLEDLGNIGEFVAAVGVIASLIYLAIQIRQNTRHLADNTKALWLAEENATQQNLSQFRQLLIRDSEIAMVFVRGLGGQSSLESTDRIRFRMLMDELMFAAQLTYHRVEASVIPECRWENSVSLMKEMAENPGFREWWAEARGRLDRDFREEMEAIVASGEPAA